MCVKQRWESWKSYTYDCMRGWNNQVSLRDDDKSELSVTKTFLKTKQKQIFCLHYVLFTLCFATVDFCTTLFV